MCIFFQLLVSFLLGRSFLEAIANPLMIPDSNDLFGLYSDNSILSEDDFFPEQLPTDNASLLKPSTTLADAANPSIESQSCSTNDVGLTGNSNPLNDLWVRDVVAREDSLLDLSPVTLSAGPQCVTPADNTNAGPGNEQTAPEHTLPDLSPLLLREKKRGQCSDPSHPVAACCTARDGNVVWDCFLCTYNSSMLKILGGRREPLASLHIYFHLTLPQSSPMLPRNEDRKANHLAHN
jgi:hypothetical protein